MPDEERVQVQHTLAVLRLVRRIDVHDGMHRLAAAGHQTGNRQLQPLIGRELILNRDHIGFHQRISEGGDIPVGRTGAVQRVKANPAAHLGLPIANGRTEVIRVLGQRGQQLTGCAVEHAAQRFPFAVLVLAHLTGNIAHIFLGPEQRRDVLRQLSGWLHVGQRIVKRNGNPRRSVMGTT